ncbi:hypothetical protein ICE94_04300 [Polynucleobacter sp. MWH-Loch1C5]|uniref:hypothetical protein n=1 Tax=Polynucleobacter sp. MWH-Loch1C5 TaxID=2689108 RepID=UPI001C0BFA2D|nr:hypothetical protein [Polynucleobacter sp. MWH-Loch1C5]MBU3542488.1 hypothetical protein [Polynucleobacter sp. MWH-Loch1C5]
MIEKQHGLVNLLRDIRWQISIHLPIGHSYIPQDIIFKVLDSYFENKEISVKILFAELPYSVMGTRHHFDRLIKSNWIELRKSDKDARVKIVLPSSKLLKRLHLLTTNLEKTFFEHQTKLDWISVKLDSLQSQSL